MTLERMVKTCFISYLCIRKIILLQRNGYQEDIVKQIRAVFYLFMISSLMKLKILLIILVSEY